MTWQRFFNVATTFSVVAVLLATAGSAHGCELFDWMFGCGHTSYSAPYCAPTAYAPAAACGCAPVQPACGCAPTSTYRISYRPVPTVAYMPVTGLDPCSGCAVTSYRPTRAWTYQASLVPNASYRAAYAYPGVMGTSACGGCSNSCGYEPSGCSSCGVASGGCSSCAASSGGCSSCGASTLGGYTSQGGCSSCAGGGPTVSTGPLPGPAEISTPSLAPATIIPSTPTSAVPAPVGSATGPAVIGPPTGGPTTIPGNERTFAPGSGGAPVAPGGSFVPSGTSERYRLPVPPTGDHSFDRLKIENVPPMNGPSLMPAPASRPEIDAHTTSRPVQQATYFQLLAPPPASIPARTVSAPVATPSASAADDDGWRHVEP